MPKQINPAKRITGVQVETKMHREATELIEVMKLLNGVSYVELARRLEERGWGAETPGQLKNKIYRGKFSFVFFIRMLAVLDVDQLAFGRLDPPDMSPHRMPNERTFDYRTNFKKNAE